MQSLNQGDVSEITPFSIEIDHCQQSDMGKLIKMTWHGTQLVDIDGHSYLITQGDSDVVLGLVDGEGKPIIWDEPIDVGHVSVVKDEQSLLFGVVARKPHLVTSMQGIFLVGLLFPWSMNSETNQ